ncbi:MAG: SOS response-associated peptidase [Acidimicrobiales bacterium]
MCGRVALFSPPARLARFLDATLAGELNLDLGSRPSWNLGPQGSLFGVSEHDGQRVLDSFRWGLVPSWAKSANFGTRLFNARGETVAQKPSFRSAFAKHPCVIPVDGFYEWDHRDNVHRQPHYFTRRDDDPLLLAGLYEHWRNPEEPDEKPLATCTIITTTPSDDIDAIHDRMPVILELGDVGEWLSVSDADLEARRQLLRPASAGTLRHFGVSTSVGSLKNDGPELINPVEPRSLF